MQTPHFNEEITGAFIFYCNTSLRFCDVIELTGKDIHKKTPITNIIQEKTGEPLRLKLHDIAFKILEKRRVRLHELAPKRQWV